MLFITRAASAAAEETPADPCEPVERASAEASRRRGLRFKEPVRCEVRSGEQIRAYVSNRLLGTGGKERLEREGEVFKALRLIPQEFDYVGALVALYSKEVGGFYDPKARLYAVAADLPVRLRESVAIHELTHALQDQRFGIAAWMDDQRSAGDTLLARAALIEGDATRVMLAGMENAAQFDSWLDSESRDIAPPGRGARAAPKRDEGDVVVRALASFPYLAGGAFVSELRQMRGERAVDAAFAKPPVSSAEILHPERYGTGVRAEAPARPYETKPAQGIVFSDTLGEFILRLVLIRAVGGAEAKKAASGWRADRALLCDGAGPRLVWRVKAADKAAVERLEKGFSALLTTRHGLGADDAAPANSDDSRRLLRFHPVTSDSGRPAAIRTTGREVELVIGSETGRSCVPPR